MRMINIVNLFILPILVSSTIKSDYWYYEGAYDNCLALAEDDHYFRTKGLDDQYEILMIVSFINGILGPM